MKKLIIKNIDKYTYTLIDEKDNIYEINLELINVNYKLQVNDILYLNNITNHNLYTFGPLSSKYGKSLNPENADEILIIDNHRFKIYTKRLYG